MNEQTRVELKSAIKIHQEMVKYRDEQYINMIQQINTRAKAILTDDMGSQFVSNCGRDLAGELVRNFFDTSDYNITVDQMAIRILRFTYEDEYDPLSQKGDGENIKKNLYNYNDTVSSTLNQIVTDIDQNQEKLFNKEAVWNNSKERYENKYEDRQMIEREKNKYYESVKNPDGSVRDEYTEQVGENTIDKNGRESRRQQVDHTQSLSAAKYNAKYITDEGKEALKSFYNSADNFAMMDSVANQSKGDVKVFDKNGNDITHRATPEQIADAICERWENTKKESTKNELTDKGYLNEDGKVPKSVRKNLIDNLRHSQNEESKVILKNTKYDVVASDAAKHTKESIGKIIAGQIIYYAAPPLIYELKCLLKNKNAKLEEVLQSLGESAKRIGKYVISKLKDIFSNVLFNSLKKFVKSFMDILIYTVKATVKKLLKIAKNLLLSIVDAVRIIADKNTSAAEKADSVFNLFGVTITSCVIEVLFEIVAKALHIPSPLDEIILGPLQILVTVVCTNLTMLVLHKLDLFDVRFGFKINAVKKIFEEERALYAQKMQIAEQNSNIQINEIIKRAREESLQIYNDLMEMDPKTQSVRGQLEGINTMFSMNINFDAEWMKFIGIDWIQQIGDSKY